MAHKIGFPGAHIFTEYFFQWAYFSRHIFSSAARGEKLHTFENIWTYIEMETSRFNFHSIILMCVISQSFGRLIFFFLHHLEKQSWSPLCCLRPPVVNPGHLIMIRLLNWDNSLAKKLQSLGSIVTKSFKSVLVRSILFTLWWMSMAVETFTVLAALFGHVNKTETRTLLSVLCSPFLHPFHSN